MHDPKLISFLRKAISRYGTATLSRYNYGLSPVNQLYRHWTNYTLNGKKIEYFHVQGGGNPFPPVIMINDMSAFDWSFESHNVDLMLENGPVKFRPKDNLNKLMEDLGPDGDQILNVLNLHGHSSGFFMNWKEKTFH